MGALERPQAYPHPTRHVESIETHMSWVFLTETRAYKLKKPLRTELIDHSTLDARRRACEREVRLNRRLAPDVYLGLAPVAARDGGVALGPPRDLPVERDPGPGVVDWLVVMRRLDRRLTLEHRIEEGVAGPDDAARVAGVLARFYARAERVEWSGGAYRGRLEREVKRYRREIDGAIARHGLEAFEDVTAAQLGLIRAAPELFDARARGRRIVDAHGDLRPEHVFLEERPAIIDCLEFDRDLRLLDGASEMSFLALECARLGAPRLGEALLEAYAQEAEDAIPAPLLRFYQSHHACIRAVVALWHLDDPRADSRSKWVRKAHRYIELAAQLVGPAGRFADGALVPR